MSVLTVIKGIGPRVVIRDPLDRGPCIQVIGPCSCSMYATWIAGDTRAVMHPGIRAVIIQVSRYACMVHALCLNWRGDSCRHATGRYRHKGPCMGRVARYMVRAALSENVRRHEKTRVEFAGLSVLGSRVIRVVFRAGRSRQGVWIAREFLTCYRGLCIHYTLIRCRYNPCSGPYHTRPISRFYGICGLYRSV
jgi:hypothetical protein